MHVIILAAGYATRLYPLTLTTPKPLLPVAGKSMIDHIIARVNTLPDVKHIWVVTNDKFYGHFLEWSVNTPSKVPVGVINDKTTTNENRLGAVGDLELVTRTARIDDDVLVIGGDNLFDFDLRDMLRAFYLNKASTIAVYDLGDPAKAANKFGVVETGSGNRIIGFEEKPASPKTALASTLCYMLDKRDLQHLREAASGPARCDNTGDFIRMLSQRVPVFAHTFSGSWYDIGNHEHYNEVQEKFR